MLELTRSLLPPLFSLAILIMANGFFNTFISLRLEMEGYGIEAIGFVVSALYLGILVGSLKIDLLIARLGHIYSFVFFAVISTILVLLQAIWIHAWYWGALRFLGGIATAGVFIVIESWLLIQSTPQMRGKVLSLYLGVFYAALSLGQFFINFSDLAGTNPFLITAFLSALSILPILVCKVSSPQIVSDSVRLTLNEIFFLSPLGFVGGVISGMILAAVYGLVPVYARESGMTFSEVGTLMAVIIFGGLSLQWPVGHWADQGNRRRVLYVTSFLTTLFGLAIPLVDSISHPFFFILAWFFGGFAFTLYPLSMAYVCEGVKENQIVAVTGSFVLSYGIGAIAGPLIAPVVMSFLGSAGLFYFLAFISLGLGLFGIKCRAKQTFS